MQILFAHFIWMKIGVYNLGSSNNNLYKLSAEVKYCPASKAVLCVIAQLLYTVQNLYALYS
jgi:hypothetical protein